MKEFALKHPIITFMILSDLFVCITDVARAFNGDSSKSGATTNVGFVCDMVNEGAKKIAEMNKPKKEPIGFKFTE